MPTITRQGPVAKPAAKKATGVVSRISPVVARDNGLKLLVFGLSKSGKTRLACTFPKPMLLIGTEDGTRSVVGIKGLDFVRLNASSEMEDLTNLLREGKYKSVALDTAGGLQDMILKEVLGLDDIPVQKSWGIAQRETWGVVGGQFKERANKLLSLADDPGLDVAIIAHERNFSDEDSPEFPSVGAALTPSAAGWLHANCDFIVHAFKRQQIVENEVAGAGGKKVKLQKRTGKVEFCLGVGPHPVYMTGMRVSGNVELPDLIVWPDYAKILALTKS